MLVHLTYKQGKINMFIGETKAETRRECALNIALGHMQLSEKGKTLTISQIINAAAKVEAFLAGPADEKSAPES